MNDDYRNTETEQKPKRTVQYENGRFYFTKETERSFYFVLTLIMLVAGILYKTGIL
jgi:hypothetical protein